MPLFAASISMRKLPGLDMVLGRLSFSLYFTATYLCLLDVGFSGIASFSPPSSGNGLKYRAAKLFTAYIRSTLLFLFLLGTLQKANTVSFTLSCGAVSFSQVPPAFHVFHAVKQIRNNRISPGE